MIFACLSRVSNAGKEVPACAEERLLESDVESDKLDLRESDLARYVTNHGVPASQTWQTIQVIYLWRSSEVELLSNLVRGPPRS